MSDAKPECNHETIRPEGLPCPHPACWTGGPVLMIPKLVPPTTWNYMSSRRPPRTEYVEDRWYLGRARIPDGTLVWGWKACP